MICVSLPGPTPSDLERQMHKAKGVADILEFRFDLYSDPLVVRKLRKEISLPVIFTSKNNDIPFLELQPDYIDLESHLPDSLLENIPKGIKIIRSYHGHNVDLPTLLASRGDLYKIALHPTSSATSLQLLAAAKKCSKPIVALTMGTTGSFTRVLAPVCGFPFTYASLRGEPTTAPGQIAAEDLLEIYHYRSLSPTTRLYALIGDPIEQSIGHIYHNRYMQRHNGCYVKIHTHPSELEETLAAALELGFCGFSITIPHKEKVIPLLHSVDPTAAAMGAVNTITVKGKTVYGTNTDAAAALALLGPVTQKKIVLLGAGGANRAIAYLAGRQGAHVTLLSRNREKALRMAEELSCQGGELDDLPQHDYDIIVNGTPSQMPIDPSGIREGSVAMDLSIRPKETEFLAEAKRKGCRIIYGEEMFYLQAESQAKTWRFFL